MTKKLTQPILHDEMSGYTRFMSNALVRVLLDEATKRGFDIEKLMAAGRDAPNGVWAQDDVEQFFQLIGYSVTGYCELDFISEQSKALAEREAEKELSHYAPAKKRR
jgi:hypothetical protein